MYTIHRIGKDGHWQQLDTTTILISAPHWLHRPCNAPTQFYRVGKKPSVKVDLTIYSHVVDVSGWCMSVLGIKLHFSSCVNWDDFCKSSHIFVCMYVCIYVYIYVILYYIRICLFITGVPKMVPDVNTDVKFNFDIITLTLIWAEPLIILSP